MMGHQPYTYTHVGPGTAADYDQTKAACRDELAAATHGVVQFTLYRGDDGGLSFNFRALLNPNDRDCLSVEDVSQALICLGDQVSRFIRATNAAVVAQIDEEAA